ncbi:MAG: hypothetical protein IPN03_11930 [Holophagales bacterium]|nr:hypothetical protein [Holophagales bacterium]
MANARNVWCGANADSLRHSNFSVQRDVSRRRPRVATARDGDPSPFPGTSILRIKRGIRSGTSSSSGRKCSEAMK